MLQVATIFRNFLLLFVALSLTTAYSYSSRVCTTTASRHAAMAHALMATNTAADGMWDVKLRSPCKINLFLRILGRRPTGYHDLASLFQTISLSDYLYMSKLGEGSTKDEFTCSDATLTINENDNLVIKALRLMREKTQIEQYFKVHLEKTVPIQAGLGGGSGNAATAMHGFNVLLGHPVKEVEQLVQWSGDIGSDISFFFSSGTAYCTGRGEIVEPLPALPLAQGVQVDVFKPPEGLSTPAVFKALNLAACSQEASESILQQWQKLGPAAAAEAGWLINDLEAPAFSCLPSLAALKSEITSHSLAAGLSGVVMSGSGTSVYAVRSPASLKAGQSLPVDAILAKFPGTKHFPCSFLSRKNDVFSWYD